MLHKLTKKIFKEAVKDTGGIVSDIAKNAGVTSKTVYDFLNKYPEMQKFREMEKEDLLDMAEGKLHAIMNYGELKDSTTLGATKFLLATQGKKRGYIEKTETEISGNLGITKINVITPEE